MNRRSAMDKAAVLIEALPWLERFHDQIVVVKYGGNAMTEDALRESFASDIVFLRLGRRGPGGGAGGLRPVVVHGGGPQINAALEKFGIESHFTAGLRVTTPEAMDVVRMVLTGQVNREVVGLLNSHGPYAVGMSGEDAHLFTARKLHAIVDGEPVDIGQVGEIVKVDPGAVQSLISDGRIPVISSVARGENGEVYNVNADTAAAALASELGAAKLIVLTDVEGLYADWPNSDEVIHQLTAAELEELMPDLSSGMVPKMGACLHAVSNGVPQAHVLDGRVPHSLLLEVFTDEGIGTMVVPS